MTDPATPEELHAALAATAPWAFAGRSPDPSELMDWLDQQTQPIAVAYLGVLLRNAERGAVCILAEHDAYPTQVEGLVGQVVANLELAGRFRTAWLSARRRAARVTEVLEALDDAHGGDPHNDDLLVGKTVHPQRVVAACRRYPDGELVHGAGPCTDPLEADPDDNPAGHPRHTNDLREPSILVREDAGGRPLFPADRPWWLCHRTGLVHTEGPCVLRDDPLDLRAGTGPQVITPTVRANLERRPR